MEIAQKSIEELEALVMDMEGTGFQEALTYCAEIFSSIDIISQKMEQRKITDPQTVDETIDYIVGYKGYLNPLKEVLDGIKQNQQDGFYINRKDELEAKGNKFTDAALKVESSHAVAAYRILRNKLEGYVAVCDTLIMVLQSKLKYYTSNREVR